MAWRCGRYNYEREAESVYLGSMQQWTDPTPSSRCPVSYHHKHKLSPIPLCRSLPSLPCIRSQILILGFCFVLLDAPG